MSTKKQNQELLSAMNVLEKEKGVKKDTIIKVLTDALATAYKNNYKQNKANVKVSIDPDTGAFKVYAKKTVVDEVTNPQEEISLKDAYQISHGYELGDEIDQEVTPANFGRIAAQAGKGVVLQQLKNAERQVVADRYHKLENDIVDAIVSREDSRCVYVELPDGTEAAMNKHDRMPNEEYHVHDHLQVYITRVKDVKEGERMRGPQVFVSRTAPDLLRRLFEKEVPEFADGPVEIKKIVREPGDRAKVAVYSTDPNVDAVGTCVGPRGSRVQAIVNQLGGENIDIVEYDENPANFIANALNPADVEDVIFDEQPVEEVPASDAAETPNEEDETEERPRRACTVVVPDDQLSLAIGKHGQNARLAANLTGYKIDIKPDSEMAADDDLSADSDVDDEE